MNDNVTHIKVTSAQDPFCHNEHDLALRVDDVPSPPFDSASLPVPPI